MRPITVSPLQTGPVKVKYVINGLAEEFHLDEENSVYLTGVGENLPEDSTIDGKITTYNSGRSDGLDIWVSCNVELAIFDYIFCLKNKAEQIDRSKRLINQKSLLDCENPRKRIILLVCST